MATRSPSRSRRASAGCASRWSPLGINSDPRSAIEAIWRIESPRLIAGLAHIVRDVGLAEEVAHGTIVAALDKMRRAILLMLRLLLQLVTVSHRATDHFLDMHRVDRLNHGLSWSQHVA